MNDALIRIRRGAYRGMTARVVSVTASDVHVVLTATGRRCRVPRSGDWFERVDDTPLTAREARELMRDGMTV